MLASRTEKSSGQSAYTGIARMDMKKYGYHMIHTLGTMEGFIEVMDAIQNSTLGPLGNVEN